MAVAQFVEQSFPTPEVCGSNPVISKILYWTFTVNYIEKMKKREETGNGPFLKKLQTINATKLLSATNAFSLQPLTER